MIQEQPERIKMAFWSANSLAVEVGTNTPKGGDAGHGGKTTLKLKDLGGTCWGITVRTNGKDTTFKEFDEITLNLGGDSEANTFIEALRFAVYILDVQQRNLVAMGELK